MVKLPVLVLVALGTVAQARPAPCPDCDRDPEPSIETEIEDNNPAFNMLGFRMGVGALPIEGNHTLTMSVGLGVEHPVFRKTRVFGEYEWLWLIRNEDGGMEPTTPRTERHGSGHRTSLGLRRELAAKKLGRSLRMFVDGELGISTALANDNVSGVQMLPAALGGLRFGYDIYSRSDDSPSRTFEAEFLLRAIAIREGIGVMFGVGMLWGN